ncbi:hypothetical protein [Mycolicibacterium pulveris]|uniref:hypothetical protein n=1 Tax=Mycolicibacterium pulveris TaxID=36813 RepID=UPI003CF6E5BB
MGLSIADIDTWNPESISAVGTASAGRADAAAQANARLKNLSAFKSWQGTASDAAQTHTRILAFGLAQHSQAASKVGRAANTAANEVRQIKSQLNELRVTLGQYGITVDANGSRTVPPANLSAMSPANRELVLSMTTIGQQSLDRIRQAADLADTHLAEALKTKGAESKQDDFDLDTQFVRSQALPGGEAPRGLTDSGIDCANYVTQLTGITTTYLSLASQCCGNKN